MVIDDDGKGDTLKSRVVVRLPVHHRKARGLIFEAVGQGQHGDAQIADHRQIVGPGNLVDARYGDFTHPMRHDPFQRHCGRHRVGIGVDDDEPVFITGKKFLQLHKTRTELAAGRHDASFSGFPRVRKVSSSAPFFQ
ncbi:MAG: hypothetical protein V8Q84_00350 [Bilophila sp.]